MAALAVNIIISKTIGSKSYGRIPAKGNNTQELCKIIDPNG